MKHLILLALSFNSFAELASSAPLLEREGPYEINWTIGKVRFYGVGKYSEDDENYRAVGQRAWAKGLKFAEHNIPIVLSNKLGMLEAQAVEKINNLAEMTLSVTSTYFGDERVKVLLETPLQKITPQLINIPAATSAVELNGESSVVINLPKNAKAAVFTRIQDEHGRELVSAKDLAAYAHAGKPLVKWYKSEAEKTATPPSAVLTGTFSERGSIRVNSAEWKPSYASAVLNGKAAIVVK